MLATSVVTGVIFVIYKSKYWKKKGAKSRQGEIETLKMKNEELEQRIQNSQWDSFFQQGHVRASKRASEQPSAVSWVISWTIWDELSRWNASQGNFFKSK
jgi:hypothetical protein